MGNFSSSSLNMTIHDTSAGGVTLVSHDLTNTHFFGSAVFLRGTTVNYPATVDAGDVATFAGAATYTLASGTNGSQFAEGLFVDWNGYNGQAASLTVSHDPVVVPEPSGLFLGLGAIFLGFIRRRG